MACFCFDSKSSNSSPKSEAGRPNDVFLTFRAKHVSLKFLQNSIQDATIKTFTSCRENIIPILLGAIEESRIVIVNFNEEFGNSKYYLEELQKMMKLTRNEGKMVLAVVRGIRSSDLHQQIGRLAELALGTSSLSGCRVSTRTHRPSHSQMMREINQVLKIELQISDISQHLVGMQARVREVLNLSKYYSIDIEKNVMIVGIWGVGGIGKTTLARTIYDTIGGSFECKSFLENIKNVWVKDNGQVCLQEQLFSDISKAKHVKILDTGMGIIQLKKVLQNKRALVVLDDVSEVDQLITLCGGCQWFGFGSMILFTARNEHLLAQFKATYFYEMKSMDESESLELFSWNAFKQSSPRNGFIDLTERVITYCEGLPLVLQVLGSLLFNRTKLEWESVLKKLNSIPTGRIQEKLKIGYEYLDHSVKDIFFNIACFYVGGEKQYVTQKLSGFQFPVETGISMLIERSFLKVDMNNKLDMHDLSQEIGKEINLNKPKPKHTYEVFLSFRGEDTRRSFATHLYAALEKAGVAVFMDSEIKGGENISSSLIQAIEGSKMSIIILSINYAGSSWCLQELEKIMECHRNVGQDVLPIFYHVQPSDVRKQTGAFGRALETLTTRISSNIHKKLSWTRALKEAANLSGWDSHHFRTDAELIDNVIETVTKKLDNNTYLFVAQHPVGVKSRLLEIVQLLSRKSNEIMFVGIFGMGGIGKTTIAKAIYNEIGRSFEGKSFLRDIRQVWEQKNGQVYLQEQLLLDILETRRMAVHSIELIMKERFCHKRSLIVLDDVNNVDQLNALCGSRAWFGPGSRIIVTTRDEHILKILQADNRYNMKEMDDNESLELFSWHAFKQASPEQDFVDLSKRVIAYSEGLPLALEILGCCLFGRPVQAWESVLDKLQRIPNDQIHKKLKISYDGLSDDMEKDIFLDICCFFIGKDRNYCAQILNGCGLHAEIGITRLMERSLVKVDTNNKLDMHGLLRDMGREIVREKSPDKPEKRTRLWMHNDVIDVLRNHVGTIAIKGLALNLSRTNTLSFDATAFMMMKRLKLLQLGHVNFEGNYECLSKELRWLCWHGCSLSYMPENFYQENAVVIDLKYNHLIEVWKKCQLMEKLKILNLSHSYDLKKTPNFSKLPNLEKLILKDCPRLSSINESIGDLKCLILVNLKDCKDLSDLPRSLYNLKSLKTLNISGCSKIGRLEEGIKQMKSLTTLLAKETAITQVPSSLVRLKGIKYVSLCGYEGSSHDVFPPLIWSWMSPTNNPRSLIHTFASMPFLLRNLFRSLSNQSSQKLETRPSTSLLSTAKTPALISFREQADNAEAENFLSSLTIQVGGFNRIVDALLKRIPQVGGCVLNQYTSKS
ncbi:disease resistance protein RUN1-like isoform X2 [Prosopis cineraria]|uniref:disease resistance protein RUN1-like isoform X2 n=1 Tax=Prosopis cineraria TaxID=364024 RepID=UPI00240FCBB3|nr:disease resistance protein RUN1-like isoform X2 [Prosopis cineraria]XP_054781597.1 disease resistance protein RUN1-like isoform X2 [Prosopis cineraria]